MTQIDLQGVIGKLKTYIAKYSEEKNNTEIAQLFLDENPDIVLSVRSIRRYVALVKEAESSLNEDSDSQDDIVMNEEFEAIAVDCDDTTKLNNDHVFNLSYLKRTYSVERRTVDKVICAYSRHGLNLTAGLIQRILDLAPVVIKAIISKLNITKESNPYSDYSAANLSAEELYAELDENTTYILARLAGNDGTATSTLNREYKKTLLLSQQTDLKFKAIVEELKEILPTINLNKSIAEQYSNYSNELLDGDTHFHVLIPDMHIGLVQTNYNLDIVRKQLGIVSSYIKDAPNLHLYFMGDIIHSVSGLNHQDTWKNMDPKSVGAEAIIQPYILLAEFISSLSYLKTVNIVGGNHDRLQSNKAQENTGEGAKLVSFMLAESLKHENVRVTFDPNKIVNNDDPRLVMIVLHGDKPIDKAPGQEIAWNLGNPNKFNYIVAAHTHSRKQEPKNDGLTFRKETLSAFCPADDYAKTVAHGSLPGVKVVAGIYDSGLPLVNDIPLYYEKI